MYCLLIILYKVTRQLRAYGDVNIFNIRLILINNRKHNKNNVRTLLRNNAFTQGICLSNLEGKRSKGRPIINFSDQIKG